MPKGLFFSLPSVSVVRTLTPVIDEMTSAGYDVIYYNTEKFRPPGHHPYTFRSYPDSFTGYYSEKIDEHTSYFQFGEILIDMASDLMDFLLQETQQEKPDFILHSHLAVWGKLLARHFHLPAITLYTTFVLDKRIMLPFFRKIYAGNNPALNHINEALGFYRKSQRLYDKLGLNDKPDLWDVYINKGDLNISFILEAFQPQREMLGPDYHFAGHPSLLANAAAKEKKLIYVAMGTILNKDLSFYKLCLDVLSELSCPCVISVGSMVDIAQLGPVPDYIRILPFVDQPAVLAESMLFLSRGGMASVHETIRSLTPMIIIPVIPEQQVTAERIEELGVGIRLTAGNLTRQTLREAIFHILENKDSYTGNLKRLATQTPSFSPGRQTIHLMNAFFRHQTVLALFVGQATQNPGKVAVICGDRQITYKELNERSGQLAHFLKRKGVARETLVPVLTRQRWETLPVMWAIMKAGGTYVPIDSEYPAARIAGLLEDMDCRLLLCSDDPGNDLIIPGNCELLLIADALDNSKAEPATLPDDLPVPRDLAYVIYTSGSTGKPKGVMVEHAQLYQYTLDVYDRMGLNECDSYALLGSFAADAGLTAIFAALCYGATLHIVDVKSFRDFHAIVDYFKIHPVDCYKITPSLLDFFMQFDGVDKILPQKKLILGGESCPMTLAKSVHRKLAKGCTLYNHYGPTETTIGVITFRFPDKETEFPAVVPLGKPLAHVNVWLLDEAMQPAPTGEISELYIEGPLVARGYLNNPEITAQKFLALDLQAKNRRLYRTGDLVRLLPDGNIEYAGRADDQVKINGHRIEPKEIENAILSDNTVKQCLVIPRATDGLASYLTAYIVRGERYDKDRLLQMLKKQLPTYMIPAKWVLLDEMPLTFNNKIDRQALPDPMDTVPEPTETPVPPVPHVPPGSGILATLTQIWCRLLGLDQAGLQDDFFSSGGDSLLLIKLGYELSDHLGIPVTATELFGYLTIERLAGYLERKSSAGIADHNGVDTDTRLHNDAALTGFDGKKVSVTQRNLFFTKKLHPSLTFPNSSLTFSIRGKIDIRRLERALSDVIRLHESLRTAYFLEKGTVYKKVETGFDFAITVLNPTSTDIDREIRELTRPFDFSHCPLLRAFWIQMANGEEYFHIDMPHINSDGESMKIILTDMAAAYNRVQDKDAYNRDNRRRLQYEDFQRSVHAYLHSAQYSMDADFWKRQFLTPVPPLKWKPKDRKTTGDPYAGNYYVSSIPAHICLEAETWLKDKELTKFQFLLIAYSLLVHKITSAGSFAIMIPVHNRNEKSLEDIVGLLSNVILLKVEMEEDTRVRDFADDCRTAILNSMRHLRFPFESLMELLKESGLDSRNLLQVFFGYHRHKSGYDLDGGSLHLHIPAKNKENLPLSLAVFDTGSGITMRWSSTAGVFGTEDLKDLMDQYLAIFQLLMVTGEHTSIASFLKELTAPSFHS